MAFLTRLRGPGLDTGVPPEVFPLAPVPRSPQVPPRRAALHCLTPPSTALPPTRYQHQVPRPAARTGECNVADEQPPDGATPASPAQELLALGPNGVRIPSQVFKENIFYFVAYTFVLQHCRSREGTEDYQRQRRFHGTCRTPHSLNAMVESIVDLRTAKVDCCKNGCVAFTADREALSACDVCKAARHRANGQPAKQATYWPLLPWLKMMFAIAQIGPNMVSAMKEAREAAAAGPPTDLREWFDGAVFRKLVEQGYFCSNTSVALSISTDGFQDWKQRGFGGWPIIATIINLDQRSRVRIVSQVILGTAPGPGQPADSESFLHPIAKELDALAAGVSGVTVAGYPEPQVVSALVVQFTTDMPAGGKLLNAVGHNGERPGRFTDFAGVRAHNRY